MGMYLNGKSEVIQPMDGVYDSSAITSNRDGNVMERQEFIIDSLLSAPPVRVTQSLSLTMVEGTYGYFNVQIYDTNGDPYLAADIDITAGTLVLEKSALGGAFSTAGITQPTLLKALGHIDSSILFKLAEWLPDDLYRLTLGGVTVTNGVTHTLQTFVWNNLISVVNDIDLEVDAILEHITVPAVDNTDTESIADVIGAKGDTPKTDLTATIMNNLKALFASSLSKRIRISDVVNDTSFKTTDLPALATGGLIGWYVFCSLDAGGLGAAPQGEYRLITNWVDGGVGTFTHNAFSTPLTTSDKVIIVHPSIYNAITTSTEVAKIGTIVNTGGIATIGAILGNFANTTLKAIIDAITVKLEKPAADAATDATIAEVVGIKADAAVVVVGTTKSVIAYVKGILTNLNLVKVETDKIPAEVVKTTTILNNTQYTQKVYPTLADAVTINGGAGAWALGNFTQVVPVNTITSAFTIKGIQLEDVSATDSYELVLYSGLAGAEVEIGRTRLARQSDAGFVNFHPLQTLPLAANTRIIAKVASKSGGDNIDISIVYK